MSDFMTADIGELLHGDDVPVESEDEKTYRLMLENDRRMLNGFEKKQDGMRWPDPVRKRHIR